MRVDYRERPKYVTNKVFIIDIPRNIEDYIIDDEHIYIRSTDSGDHLLYIAAGTTWDSPLELPLDKKASETIKRASLVHYICRQLIKSGCLDYNGQDAINVWCRKLLKEDGVSLIGRWLWYFGVKYLAYS